MLRLNPTCNIRWVMHGQSMLVTDMTPDLLPDASIAGSDKDGVDCSRV
jgi:hypothetical protein